MARSWTKPAHSISGEFINDLPKRRSDGLERNYGKDTYEITCTDPDMLSKSTVLKTLSMMKADINYTRILEGLPAIDHFICTMSESVKSDVVAASKRLKMYGKKPVIIPQFDEWGNRLPDVITIDTEKGITLCVIPDDESNSPYLSIEAVMK